MRIFLFTLGIAVVFGASSCGITYRINKFTSTIETAESEYRAPTVFHGIPLHFIVTLENGKTEEISNDIPFAAPLSNLE